MTEAATESGRTPAEPEVHPPVPSADPTVSVPPVDPAPPVPPTPPAPPARLTMARPDWILFGTAAALAALTRLLGLNYATSTSTPIFDEKHYVPEAWQILRSTGNPLIGGIEDNPGYGLVVHPPVAKQIMALGEAVFGYTELGWRIMSALVGIVIVLLVMAIARRLTRDRFTTGVAGLLAVCDGVLLTSSRVGMLDIFLTVFVLAAAWLLLVDRDDAHARMHRAWAQGRIADSPFGPRHGVRWWRLAAGVALALAVGVKWSGLYYVAAFGLLTFGLDIALRRRYGVARPWSGALLRDAAPAFGSLVIVPVVGHFLLWRSWFASETGVYRHVVGTDEAPDTGWMSLLPDGLHSWLHYQSLVLTFHSELTTSSGHHHPWESKPWDWLWAGKPMLYSNETYPGCGGTCHEVIMLFGSPAVWWLIVPVVVAAAVLWLWRRDATFALPVTGFLAGWLPWMVTWDRQMYFFYATAMIPFVLVALAIVLGRLLPYRGGPTVVVAYLTVVVIAFLFYVPIMVGWPVGDAGWMLRLPVQSWRA